MAKKRVNGNGLAMLLDLDDCMGCFGCEAACRDTNRYDYEEDWMRCLRRGRCSSRRAWRKARAT